MLYKLVDYQSYEPVFSMFEKNNTAGSTKAIFRLSCLSLVVSRIQAENYVRMWCFSIERISSGAGGHLHLSTVSPRTVPHQQLKPGLPLQLFVPNADHS